MKWSNIVAALMVTRIILMWLNISQSMNVIERFPINAQLSASRIFDMASASSMSSQGIDFGIIVMLSLTHSEKNSIAISCMFVFLLTLLITLVTWISSECDKTFSPSNVYLKLSKTWSTENTTCGWSSLLAALYWLNPELRVCPIRRQCNPRIHSC